MNNKRLNAVCEILKIRGGENVAVRDDLQGATFFSNNVPLMADIQTILRAFFTNAEFLIDDMSWMGYDGISAIYLVYGEWRDKIDTNLVLMSVKATDEERVIEIIKGAE